MFQYDNPDQTLPSSPDRLTPPPGKAFWALEGQASCENLRALEALCVRHSGY